MIVWAVKPRIELRNIVLEGFIVNSILLLIRVLITNWVLASFIANTQSLT